MLRRLQACSTICLALIACGDGDVILVLPESTHSLPSLVLWANGSIEVSAGAPIRPPTQTGQDRVDLVVLAYAATHVELELELGSNPAGTTCRPCRLLEPDEIWTARVEGSEVALDWQALRDIPPDVLADLVPDADRCDRCRPFEKIQVPADVAPSELGRVAFVAHLEDGDVIAYNDGTIRLAHPDRTVSSEAPAPDACLRSDDFLPVTGYRATPGLLWVVDAQNRVFRFDLDRLDPNRPCADAATLSSTIAWEGPPLKWIAGPPSEAPGEIFGVGLELPPNDDTIVSRYTFDGRTERLGILEGPENEAGIAWSGMGRAIAVNGDKRMLRIEGDQARFDRMEIDGVELFITSVDYLPDRGYVFGTSNGGAVLESGRGKYSYLQETPGVHQRVDRVISYGDGLAIGERNGVVRLFFDEEGYCPGQIAFYDQTSDYLQSSFRGALIGGLTQLYYAIPQEDVCTQ